MLLLLIKIITVITAIVAISKSYLDYRKHQEPNVMFGFWTIIWLGAATIVVYPSLIDQIVVYTKDKSVSLSSLTGLAFILMLFIIYRIYTKAARIEYQQNQLIRQLGLRRHLAERKRR